jgi:hypothetical protein
VADNLEVDSKNDDYGAHKEPENRVLALIHKNEQTRGSQNKMSSSVSDGEIESPHEKL